MINGTPNPSIRVLVGMMILKEGQAEATNSYLNNHKKWRIMTENGNYRYFNLEYERIFLLRQKLRNIPKEELNRRNNVEATIFMFNQKVALST